MGKAVWTSDSVLDVLNRVEVHIFLGALLAIAAVGEFWAWRGYRRRACGYGVRFQTQERASREAASRFLKLPEAALAERPPDWFARGQAIVDAANDASSRYQQRYHWRATRTIALLSTAAIIVVVTALFVPETTDTPTLKILKKFVAAFDVLAVLFSILSFIAARKALRRWLQHRVATEITRVQLHLMLPFALASEKPDEAAKHLADHHKSLLDRLHVSAYQGARRATAHIIEEAQAAILDSCSRAEWRLVSDPARQASALWQYIIQRPLAEYGYFMASHQRLEEKQRTREWLLFGLFGLTVLIAFGKLLLAFEVAYAKPAIEAAHQWVSLPGTMLTALFVVALISSATVTSAAINRHESSLMSAYVDRIEAIKAWMTSFRGILRESKHDADTTTSRAIREAICAFEILMLQDVYDFAVRTEENSIKEIG